jgi:hypothetical protein
LTDHNQSWEVDEDSGAGELQYQINEARVLEVS